MADSGRLDVKGQPEYDERYNIAAVGYESLLQA